MYTDDPHAALAFGIPADLLEEEARNLEMDLEMAREIATGIRMAPNAIDLALEQAEFVRSLDRGFYHD